MVFDLVVLFHEACQHWILSYQPITIHYNKVWFIEQMLAIDNNLITTDLGVILAANGKSTPYRAEAKATMYTPQGSFLAMVDQNCQGCKIGIEY